MSRHYAPRRGRTRSNGGWCDPRGTCRQGELAMKHVVITTAGGPDVLRVREVADPEPGGRDVRIRVRATGINFADILARRGLYPDAPKLPAVVGYEVSGVVDAAGPEARSGWVG